MITEDKVTELFCIADDFYQDYSDPIGKKRCLKQTANLSLRMTTTLLYINVSSMKYNCLKIW